MSLQVWLPLDGDLNNNGLDAPDRLTAFSTTFKSGKFQKCLDLNGVKSASGTFSNLSGLSRYSFCCWIKVDSSNITNYADMLVLGSNHDGNTGGIRIEHTATAGAFQIIYNKSASGGSSTVTYYSVGNSATAAKDTWLHIAVVNDGTKVKTYFNGELQNTYTVTNIYSSGYLSGSIILGTSGSYASLNDVRVYDHCLSVKEIEEISKGLVLHLPLDTHPNPNLLANTSNPVDGTNLVSTTQSVVYDDKKQANVFERTQTVTSESFIYSSRTPQVSQSTSYTFSCDLCANDYVKSIDLFWLSDTASNKKSGSGYVNITSVSSITIPYRNQWFHYVWTFTTKSDDYTGYIRIDNNGSSTDGVAASLRATNLKLEIGTSDTGYIPSVSDDIYSTLGFDVNDTIERDVSGYGNNGTITGSLGCQTDSVRNTIGTYFNGSSYINCGRSAMVKDALTVNWWGYMDDWNLYGSKPMRALSCTEGGGWNFEPSSSKMSFACGTGSSSNSYKSVTSITAFSSYSSGWHMFTGTYDGYSSKIYIDGVLENTNSAYTTKTPMYYNTGNSIFIGVEAGSSGTAPATPYFTGGISDVRIYATALSEAAVADLYKSSASIDKTGRFYTNSFYECTKDSQVTKSAVLSTGGISEMAPIFDMRIKSLVDGSAWARIYWLDLGTYSTTFADKSEVLKCTSAINRYSRMGIVDNFVSTDGCYEFMLTYPSLSNSLYNRWKQTNSPNVSANLGTGYDAITTAWATYANPLTLCYSSGSAIYCTNVANNWWSPIGQLALYNGGIPAADGSTQSSTELWVRIDNLSAPSKASFYKDLVVASNFIEW